MIDMPLGNMTLKLMLAWLLGGLIGMERETHGGPAGLRTHILVCMGSALFTLCSYAIAGKTNDPGRITAQIVTGIGFLGAGTIMRQGSVVRGLTTAASVWTVAAIGIAVAIGGEKMVFLAAAATILVVITLNVVPHLERMAQLQRGEKILSVTMKASGDAVSQVFSMMAKQGTRFKVLGMETNLEATQQTVRLQLYEGRGFDETALDGELTRSDSVVRFSWE